MLRAETCDELFDIIDAIEYVKENYGTVPIDDMSKKLNRSANAIISYANKKVKYMHFIWHIFVLAGSVLQYFFILSFYTR